LVLQVLVCCDEDIKAAGFGSGEKLAVPERGPALLTCGSDRVAREEPSNRNRCALIEQDDHRR
jgi:hypothetical protein